MSSPKVVAGKKLGTIKSRNFGQNLANIKYTFGGDMSPLKMCVENLVNGQRICVPAQHTFCRLTTFREDKGASAKSVVIRPLFCCSEKRVYETLVNFSVFHYMESTFLYFDDPLYILERFLTVIIFGLLIA